MKKKNPLLCHIEWIESGFFLYSSTIVPRSAFWCSSSRAPRLPSDERGANGLHEKQTLLRLRAVKAIFPLPWLLTPLAACLYYGLPHISMRWGGVL